ncbi:MAG TPA: methyltransferase domain-containing protein [Xanthobacteraceae bacterium]|jgi:predicted TPR repeat methyltransferase|nr:methyltransferase domain-containing protein [Xanthobacteraceae bacterium]
MSLLSALFLSSGDPALDRRHEWARGLLERGDVQAAIELLDETLIRGPRFIAGWFLLGEANELAGNKEAAITAFRRALKLDPEDRLGAGLRLARLRARKPQTMARAMSPAYVRTLFDQYAGRFDRELVEALHYSGPALIAAALVKTAGERRFKRVLDLGCGTGLMGEAIRGRAEQLIGVDLSENMVGAARRKQIYDRLAVADLAYFLAAEPETFDLILAADVFVYLPDLKPVCAAVAHKLLPDGLFAFTVETHEGGDAILRDTLRFAHGERHLRDAASAAGMRILLLENVATRQEQNRPVEGLLAVLGAS